MPLRKDMIFQWHAGGLPDRKLHGVKFSDATIRERANVFRFIRLIVIEMYTTLAERFTLTIQPTNVATINRAWLLWPGEFSIGVKSF